MSKVIQKKSAPAALDLEKKYFEIADFKSGKDAAGNEFIEGYANTKNKPDRYGDIPTVFEELRDYVYELKEFKLNPVALIDHDNSAKMVVGSFDEKLGGYIKEDDKGLAFKLVFTQSNHPDIAHVRQVYMEGHAKALSVGGRWYREDKDNVDHLTLLDIFEVSLVGVGADPRAVTKDLQTKDELRNLQKKVSLLEKENADLAESRKACRVLSESELKTLTDAKEVIETVLANFGSEKRIQIIKGGK